MTHGGLLSTQEAIYHGVPLIVIPIFGDQDMNMRQAENAGYSLTLEIMNFTQEGLQHKIDRLINEPQ